MKETDRARSGEELDEVRLAAFLRKHHLFKSDQIEIVQFAAGSSNLTYLIRDSSDEYVLRRPPIGNIVKTAHDMKREYEVLSKLSAVYAAAPRPLLFCDNAAVIGSEFYLMERRSGLVIRGRAPKALVDSAELQIAVCRGFIQSLVDLHKLDYKSAGLGELGKPVGYCRRQVEGWINRYIAAKTDEWPEVESVAVWLRCNIPEESGAALIHNDYKFDNVMLDPHDLTKTCAVLDWEMVTIGDPLMDLGTTLGYWMAKGAGDAMLNMPFNPRILMENISRQDLTDMYAEQSGNDISNILFYYVFGTFKIAVIAQQIFARFKKGLTTDSRFAGFDSFVAALGRFGAEALDKGSI
ncbi:MAG: phosphotransferase family protein [Acidobacteriota bacterium]